MLRQLRRLAALPPLDREGLVRRLLYVRYPALEQRRIRRDWARLERRTARLGAERGNPAADSLYLSLHAHRLAGIGHALAEWNTALLFAQSAGLAFAYSGFNEPWESFFGFHAAGPSVHEVVRRPGAEVVLLPWTEWKTSDPLAVLRPHLRPGTGRGPTVFLLGLGQNSVLQHPTAPSLRRWYFAHPGRKVTRYYRADRLNVAVHIRRRNRVDLKDASVADPNSPAYRARYVELEYFAGLMRIIVEASPQAPVFHLFSQGAPEDFAPLQSIGEVVPHIDANEQETFHNMVASDVFITSPSSFSFKAGMVSPGLKLARHPWWHEVPEDEEWIRIPADPAAAREELVARVRARLPARLEAARALCLSA